MPHSANDRDARERMVADQLVARGIHDARVLDAMRRVPREQTISQPYMVAVMTEELSLEATARVLDVGTGLGYQAAILGELARDVITIEWRLELAKAARQMSALLG